MPRQFWQEPKWIAYANGTTIVSSTAEALLMPDRTIYADTMQDNKALRLTVRGKISNVVTTPGTITFRLRWGGLAGTILAQSAALQMSATAFTDAIFAIYLEIMTRANGASGSILAMGECCAGNLSTVAPNYMGSAGALVPAAVTADLTVDKFLSITGQFSISNASNSLTGMEYILEELN